MKLPESVRIVEVGPRDGLQNESHHPVPLELRVELIERLARCGLQHIETGSFVSPRKVPAMANTQAVFNQLKRQPGVHYTALTPNLKGLEQALLAGADEVAVFTAASESFCQHNIDCSIAQSLVRFRPVIEHAAQEGIAVRGYVSTVISCPYEGAINPAQVAALSRELLDMGCYEISLGDTTGTGTPASVCTMLNTVRREACISKLAAHFHDTYGQALTNIYAVLKEGIRVFDTSVAGLGGCPYAPGASGNLASEDLVYLLEGLGINTGIDLKALAQTGHWISQQLGRHNTSRTGRALSG